MTSAVVITAHDQGTLVAEAVASVRAQTLPPAEVVVVDDGSRDPGSIAVLDGIAARGEARVLRQENRGVSAARNAGIAATSTPLVAVLDGDDRWEPTFLARTVPLLDDPAVVAASSWMRLHGVATGVVEPPGGTTVDFLHRNACPATAVLRRSAWQRAGGYDEGMRAGFEDWDLFLGLVADGGRVAIVPEPLIGYRTAPASANVRSMAARLDRYAELIDKHRPLFERHLREVLLAQEATAVRRLDAWEALVRATPGAPVGPITYGDGGMAAVVRIATHRAEAASGAGPA
jgi:glycosyltransferase involved in cell wall biosynthesis